MSAMRTSLLLLLLSGCSPTNGVSFELAPLSVDIGLSLEATCELPDTIDGACKLVEEGTATVLFPTKLEGELSPTTCSFVLTGSTRCAEPRVTIFVASFSGRLFAEESEALQLPAASLSTAFDEDADGFSNYGEHLGGSNPSDPSSVPKSAGDAGTGDAR